MRVSLISGRVAGWVWLACLLGLLGVWDLGAKVPSSSLRGKTLPLGCAWNLNNNNDTATSFTVDNLNQLTAGPTSPYTNDNNGNLTGQVNYYAYGYSYDYEDQLTSVIFSGISKSDFKYDGLGRLRQRLEYTWYGYWYLSSTVNYVYDGRRVIQERDGNNTPTVSYTRGLDLGGSLEGAGGIGGLLARSHGYSGGSWSTHNYYHADGGGNITYIMNASQTAAATYKYDPFGTTLAQSGTLANANVYRFSSKEFHSASGLYHYGFRFYDPNLQRWMNHDPMGETGGINIYAFCENDSINNFDAYGDATKPLNPTGNNSSPPVIYDESRRLIYVSKCNIVILFGHGAENFHWTWKFSRQCNAATAIMCWPTANANGIPEDKDLWQNKPDPDPQIQWGKATPDPNDPSITKLGSRPFADQIFDQVYANAKKTASELCKRNCCSSIRIRFLWNTKHKGTIENPNNNQTDYKGNITIQDYSVDCKTGKQTLIAR